MEGDETVNIIITAHSLTTVVTRLCRTIRKQGMLFYLLLVGWMRREEAQFPVLDRLEDHLAAGNVIWKYDDVFLVLPPLLYFFPTFPTRSPLSRISRPHIPGIHTAPFPQIISLCLVLSSFPFSSTYILSCRKLFLGTIWASFRRRLGYGAHHDQPILSPATSLVNTFGFLPLPQYPSGCSLF